MSACTAWHAAQQTPGVEPVLVLCWVSVADGGPKLDQHWVNVSCLPEVLTGHICVLHITGCEDIKTVAQLIKPKDDLVTVNHLPSIKSWHSEVSRVANLTGEDDVDNYNISHQFKNDVMPILDEMHSCNVYYFIFFNFHIFMFLYYHFTYFPDYRWHGFVQVVQVGVSGRRDRGAPSVMWSVCSNVNWYSFVQGKNWFIWQV